MKTAKSNAFRPHYDNSDPLRGAQPDAPRMHSRFSAVGPLRIGNVPLVGVVPLAIASNPAAIVIAEHAGAFTAASHQFSKDAQEQADESGLDETS